MSNPVFWENMKNIINLSSTENAMRVAKRCLRAGICVLLQARHNEKGVKVKPALFTIFINNKKGNVQNGEIYVNSTF